MSGTAKKQATKSRPEDHPTVTKQEESAKYFMYRAGFGDEFLCCFCVDKIKAGDVYRLIEMPLVTAGVDTVRRAHHVCVDRVLRDVVLVRDKNGKSEDIQSR